MSTEVFVRGVVLGFSIAAPVGPIGLLVIRRALVDGRVAGLATGLGAATADAIFGAIAAFGVTAVTGALAGNVFWLRLIGGAFLVVLGVRAARSRPSDEDVTAARSSGLARAFATTLLLTLTNPMTILSFAAMMASVGAVSGAPGSAMLFVVAVFAGSALWWLALSGGVGALRSRISPRSLRWVNVGSGAVLMVFGVVAIVGAL